MVDQLRDTGVVVRATCRHPDAQRWPWAETVAGDLDQPHTLRPALDGVDAVFLYSFARPETLTGLAAEMRAAVHPAALTNWATARLAAVLDEPRQAAMHRTAAAALRGWRTPQRFQRASPPRPPSRRMPCAARRPAPPGGPRAPPRPRRRRRPKMRGFRAGSPATAADAG
nr:hypothetical protein [Mycolicibacterium poriferae]